MRHRAMCLIFMSFSARHKRSRMIYRTRMART
nr:MAG TPA: hypothetical protein [Caudoviricetes sp.]DAY67024.1 MAG TPA: hypothetical protein [Caudoviricetes sp.]